MVHDLDAGHRIERVPHRLGMGTGNDDHPLDSRILQGSDGGGGESRSVETQAQAGLRLSHP